MNTAPSAAARGFTLVELLITMSILSIALAIAVPSFSETAATQRVRVGDQRDPARGVRALHDHFDPDAG